MGCGVSLFKESTKARTCKQEHANMGRNNVMRRVCQVALGWVMLDRLC
jgi:hypothetical protein